MKRTQIGRSGPRPAVPAAAGLLVALVLLISCNPDAGFNTLADYDVVGTYYDPDTDFDSLATYAMPDTVIHFRDPEGASSEELSREYDELVLGLVRTNLEAMGYEEETDPRSNEPDVYVVVWVTLDDWLSTATEGWWDMWGWYPHWPVHWGPAWGSWYPYPIQYFYRAGSIFINMVDEAEIEEGEEPYIKFIWTGTVNGIMVDTSEGAVERLTTNINQAFDQSPYLATE